MPPRPPTCGRPVASEGGGAGGARAPHFLADQLTLSQPGGAHYPHPVLRAPPDFQTLRRPCIIFQKITVWPHRGLSARQEKVTHPTS